MFDLVSKYRKINARESTLLYIAVIIYFLTLPFILVPVYSITKLPKSFFMVLVLGYAGLIYYLNKRYFERKNKLRKINEAFRNESVLQKRIGYSVVVILLLSSFVLFFFFLSIL